MNLIVLWINDANLLPNGLQDFGNCDRLSMTDDGTLSQSCEKTVAQ